MRAPSHATAQPIPSGWGRFISNAGKIICCRPLRNCLGSGLYRLSTQRRLGREVRQGFVRAGCRHDSRLTVPGRRRPLPDIRLQSGGFDAGDRTSLVVIRRVAADTNRPK